LVGVGWLVGSLVGWLDWLIGALVGLVDSCMRGCAYVACVWCVCVCVLRAACACARVRGIGWLVCGWLVVGWVVDCGWWIG
jgi:hypothetical protein